ncbi:hypothetical protein [Lewinella sp. 4G2]|uniref:hypothetical protein n=1 Tax=Lewinella sp. 4G2 TaxID=1803372 RepID=UPI0007B4E7B3|nr:hypothetical protein [Lewinella sp. 4G2]OAV45254.1 hypothetical protein A3850_012450 [Lewinella sp. 4G2]
MYLLYDTNLAADWPYLLGIAVILLGMVLYYLKVKREQAERAAAQHDPRSHVVNDSNYNIAREGMDGHRTEEMSPTEARNAVSTLKETEQVPTRAEYNAIKDDLSKA